MSGGIAFGDLNQEQILDFQVKGFIDIYDGFSVKSIYILCKFYNPYIICCSMTLFTIAVQSGENNAYLRRHIFFYGRKMERWRSTAKLSGHM